VVLCGIQSSVDQIMFIALLGAAVLMAQTAAAAAPSLSGVVYDQQRAAIPRARIQIECGAVRRLITAGAFGEFAATGLPTGPCTIAVTAPLFEPATVRLSLHTDADVALVLRVRAVEADVTVSASRGVLQEGVEVPRSISTTTRADIDARPYQLLPEVLGEEPGILVQQTTTAQASPMIRGFTGQSNVYLLDGVRLNTSAWRTGPSQYVSWLDPGVVERIDVVRGPGSVQYGSDALGGTINVLSSVPSFSLAGLRIGGSADAILGSADASRGGGLNLVVQAPRVALRFGVDVRDVHDLRPGGGRDSHAAVTRFLGLPSDTIGTRLEETGFRQSGGFVTGSIRAGSRATVNTVFIHQDQTGASRYDRIHGGDGLHRSGFEPQTLDFLAVRYRRQGTAGFDELSATGSLNRQSDGRFEQARPTAALDAQRAVTTSYGYQFDGQRRVGTRHRLGIGGEIYDEWISASREQTDPRTQASQRLRPDIPEGTRYTTAGVFVQDVTELIPGRLSVQGGLRYGRFSFSTAQEAALGVTAEQVSTDAVTFDAGTVLRLTKQLHMTFAVSRGFRAANAADLGSVGLTGGGGFEIAPSTAAGFGAEVGSTSAVGAVSTGRAVPALGPEVAYTYEPGVKFQSDRISASITGFDIRFLDAIQRRAAVFPGNVVGQTISGFTVIRQDSAGLAYIAEDQRPIGTRVNVDRARIRGFEAEATYRFARGWRARAYYSLSNGRLSTGEFMRRMPPPLGGLSLRWGALDDRRWVEGVVAVARRQRRFNAGDVSDARIGGLRTRAAIASYFNGTATDLGLVAGGVLVATGENLAAVQNRVLGTAASAPLYTSQAGFAVIGLRAGWKLSSTLEAMAIGENLTDRNYRLYGSGVDAPGVNLQLRLRYSF
jgi:outer membrane receptor protein involved in Fe transport